MLSHSYISYRQSFTHHPAKKPRYIGASNGFTDIGSQSEESRRLISESTGIDDDGNAIIEMDVLPPRWVDVQEEVTELLEDIAQKSTQLDKLHHKHLLPGFGDEDVRKQDERVIERYTQDITRGFHECQKLVQRIELMVYEAKQQGGVSSGDETMAKNIQISLASRVQDASARFRKKQSTYLRSEPARHPQLSLHQLAHPKVNRITRSRRLGVTIRSLADSRAKSLHRSVLNGV
jgi:syntaxin 16